MGSALCPPPQSEPQPVLLPAPQRQGPRGQRRTSHQHLLLSRGCGGQILPGRSTCRKVSSFHGEEASSCYRHTGQNPMLVFPLLLAHADTLIDLERASTAAAEWEWLLSPRTAWLTRDNAQDSKAGKYPRPPAWDFPPKGPCQEPPLAGSTAGITLAHSLPHAPWGKLGRDISGDAGFRHDPL